MYCAPDRESQKLTCYKKDELIKLAKAYNESHSNKINIKNKTQAQLLKGLREALGNKCNDESCWIEQDFAKKNARMLKEAFRPKMPKIWKYENYTTWLSSLDIDKVMEQYQKKYPDFLYINAIPIDCEIDGTLQCPLKNFDIVKAYKNGVRCVGSIENTAASYSNGEHWIAWFIKLPSKSGKKAEMSFFDSYGSLIPKEIMRSFKIFQHDLEQIGIKSTIDRNKVRKQYDGFSCGTYSLFFLIKMLEGKTLKQIEKMKMTTEQMQKFKKQIFRSPE